MKRLVVLVLLTALMLLCVAKADVATCDTEILFRDLPWGCSIDEAIKNFQNSGIDNARLREDEDVYSMNNHWSGVDKSAFEYSSTNLSDDFFVGGHLVDEIYAYAIYGIKDGQVSKKTEDSKLYKGAYFFKSQDNVRGVYDDLVDKLTGLYGEPEPNLDSIMGESQIWYGLNNTAVVITIYDEEFSLLYLEYWDLNVEEMINEMQSVAYVGDIASTDGL